MDIISQTLITDPFQILEAGIIDWNRLNGCWRNVGDALNTIFSWFDGMATLTKVHIPNYHDAPHRNDWLGWDHAFGHESSGKAYFDWFFWNHPKGELTFSDSPDFFGKFAEGGRFYGDIGLVSASAFAMTQKMMRANDLWITIQGDGCSQVLIETHVDLAYLAAMRLPYYKRGLLCE